MIWTGILSIAAFLVLAEQGGAQASIVAEPPRSFSTNFAPVAKMNPGISWAGARVGVTKPAKAEVHPPLPAGVMAESSSTKYVIAGALVGVAVYGVALAIYFSQSSDEFLANPLALAVPAIGAAGLGALAGYLVFKARSN